MTCCTLLGTGDCGCVGSMLMRELRAAWPDIKITGLDNFVRDGGRSNVEPLCRLGSRWSRATSATQAKFDALQATELVLDCAAEPSVLAGVPAGVSSSEGIDHNLVSTIRVLEYCKRHGAGFALMSTSGVCSIAPGSIAGRGRGRRVLPAEVSARDPTHGGRDRRAVSHDAAPLALRHVETLHRTRGTHPGSRSIRAVPSGSGAGGPSPNHRRASGIPGTRLNRVKMVGPTVPLDGALPPPAA